MEDPSVICTGLACCGLVYGSQEHHLDHIATLCAYLHIPLIVTDETIENLAHLYYPDLNITLLPSLKIKDHLLKNHPVVITAMPSAMFDSMFFLDKKLHKNPPLTIWCPHGNSDKGQDSFFMETLRKEKIVFVYGEKMLHFLKDKEALSKECIIIPIGNYRYAFYQNHKFFYQNILYKTLPPQFLANKTTYLYAPTWKDHENASSLHLAIPHLLEDLPKEVNLIIKLHPNTLLKEDLFIKKLIWKYESAPNIFFLENFPLIYPLLDFVDVYIGDTSSIGYDFLSFNKPMFFLNIEDNKPLRYLYQCGTVLKKEDFSSIYIHIENHLKKKPDLFSQKRKEIYDYTFSDKDISANLLEDINHLYNKIYHEL